MAIIYSGIHVKLKSPLTPWSDKLKLARFAWVSRQCLLPNKEQVLFDWVSHALIFYYNKKVEVPLEVVEGLWAYFDEILHSKKLYNVLSQGKAITLNPSVAQIISERILESTSGTLSVSLSMILSCCHGILTSPVLSVTYTARYELLVKLLARVCGLACFQLKQQRSAEPLLLKVFEVLFLVLSTYLTVQRQQGNTNRVFTQVTEHLFQPLLLLRHLLATRIWTEEDDTRIRQHLNKEIRSRVDTILQSALFSSDHLLSYTEEVLPSEDKSHPKKELAGRPLLCPISIIMSKLVSNYGDDDEALFYAVKCSSLPLLFKLALDSFCKKGENKLVCFQFMTKLVTALEFTKDLSIKKSFNTGNWSLVLLALESILNYCLAGDVYNVAADRMYHGEVQFNFYRKVAQLLLNNDAQTGIPAWYRCLKTLLALNHQILEPDLDEIVSFVWVDVDNMEFRVKKARETLVSEVLQTYSKLRQLPRLIDKLVDVICRPADYELRRALLPQAVQKSLSQCLMNNPPSQNLEVCMLILEKMQTELSNMKKTREASALKLFSLSILLHAVMFSLKALDDSTPVPIVRQTQSLMEKMLTFLRALLQNLETQESDRLWREKIQDTSLLLTHTWHEADALFQIHCSKYTSPAGLSNDVSPISDTIEKALAITGSVDQDISPLSKLLQKHLALHKMKKHLLTSNENTRNILFESANYVVDRENSLMNPNMDHTWDLQLCTVNSDNYSVACWFLIITNLPLISPYLSQENASHIADVILNSVLENDFGSNTEKTDTLSASHISRQLLESLVLCELPSVYTAVVTSIIKRIFGQLCADIHSVCPSFFKSCTEMDASENKEEGTVEISPSLKRLRAMAQEIMDSAKAGTSLPLSEKQVGNLQQLIKITAVLNPYAMSPEDYLELFLSSFLMNLCVQHHENGSCSVPINLLKAAYDLMTFLVQSQSHKVLKVVHGSTLLESTMTSLLSSLSKGLFGSVDVSVWISLLRSVQCFIQCLIQMIICRKISVRLNLETFTNFMVAKVVAVGTSVNSGKCEEAQRLIELHLATLSTLCKEMMSLFGNNKHLNETVTKFLEKAIFVMVPAIQPVITATAGSVIRKSFTVDVVTVMIESELAMASHHTDDIAVGEAQDKLSHTVVYKRFGQQIMKEFCSEPQPMDFLISSIHYLSALYLAAMTTKESDLEDLYLEILKGIHKLLSSVWLSGPEVKELEAPVKDLLDQLVISCSEEQFHLLLLMFQDGLVASKIERGYYRDVLATVTVIKLLACCSLPGICSKAFWAIVPQIISSLVFLVRESSGVASLTSALTLPAVDTLTTLLRRGESWISSAHNVTTVLGALQFVPLENQSMEDYHSAFQAIHEALFAIILCYPKVMLKSAPTFLNCFYRLVASIMYEGKQKGMNEREKGSEELLKCARLVERMYTHIGKTAEGFTIMSSFIVAQYVNQLQKVTLRPEIKAHLTEGIYCILDQCIEKDIKFLNRTLQMGVKEVFDELYKNYMHYHKSQWQGEEKYTA